ncbi:glycoside/pentoside/hexuronide:cation symporter, GPH family [Algoriphagus ornithinivorans]|uniref:Glycoside/pentoside/hexuronide:cation symporter, GPH family n=1 Tax=Algoriphagus ornithinivorans TaxID=226506 RepID=A0A1I5ADH4_9BACT|nr:MFS transporter [Algoriphagus ornithinivorans]SFN60506.1 glycoside/pentoside/hexuronide:cation symporter, GPH family [Algoriphagus ornithinivorans]
MSKFKTAPEDIVPFVQKFAFGAGNLANQLFPAALGAFMYYLVVAYKMDPLDAALLSSIPRLLDAITDPIMGYVTDNTRSKWGRRKPYIFLGSFIAGITFIMMWQLNPEDSSNFHFWYILTLSFVFYIGYTIFATPLIGLGYEMTSDYNERTRLMASSQIIGQLAWMIAPWIWWVIAQPNIFPTQTEGVRTVAIVTGIACLILAILPSIFCKEIDQTNLTGQSNLSLKDFKKNMLNLFKGMKEILTNQQFLRVCGATFLVFNGFQIVAQFSLFIIVYYMFNGDYGVAGQWPAWYNTLAAASTMFLVIPIITKLATKYGKKNAFIISTFISIIGYGIKWWGFNPEITWLMFIQVPFMSFGIGGLFTLMMSMTADLCDLDELRNGMPRKEGTFGAVYWLMVKIGSAIALTLSGMILSFVGWDQNQPTQTMETLTNLRIADVIVPIVAALLAVVTMWNYNVTEERANEIRNELIKRRGRL